LLVPLNYIWYLNNCYSNLTVPQFYFRSFFRNINMTIIMMADKPSVDRLWKQHNL